MSSVRWPGLIKVKRVYESPELVEGARFLADRLWPRGLKKRLCRLLHFMFVQDFEQPPDPKIRAIFTRAQRHEVVCIRGIRGHRPFHELIWNH
jgi:uncharacterized protein YeaO (DUF488 family)